MAGQGCGLHILVMELQLILHKFEFLQDRDLYGEDHPQEDLPQEDLDGVEGVVAFQRIP